MKKLQEADIRVELDDSAETISRKVREAQLEKANYIITIGDKECEKKCLAVRTRAGKVKFEVKAETFVEELQEEIKLRKS
jgi:threonyl-tRNA synthetase